MTRIMGITARRRVVERSSSIISREMRLMMGRGMWLLSRITLLLVSMRCRAFMAVVGLRMVVVGRTGRLIWGGCLLVEGTLFDFKNALVGDEDQAGGACTGG